MRTRLAAICCAGLCLGSLAAEDEHAKFLENLNHVKQVASTVPPNSDVNPYGRGLGRGPFLRIDADGGAGGKCVGLTTALLVLRAGWVIAGSLPTSDGTSATMQAGCLIVLKRWRQPVESFAGGDINGPDMTALDLGNAAVLFVSNVLNGTVAQAPTPSTKALYCELCSRCPMMTIREGNLG